MPAGLEGEVKPARERGHESVMTYSWKAVGDDLFSLTFLSVHVCHYYFEMLTDIHKNLLLRQERERQRQMILEM